MQGVLEVCRRPVVYGTYFCQNTKIQCTLIGHLLLVPGSMRPLVFQIQWGCWFQIQLVPDSAGSRFSGLYDENNMAVLAGVIPH